MTQKNQALCALYRRTTRPPSRDTNGMAICPTSRDVDHRQRLNERASYNVPPWAIM
ncbi:hypothetical protein [Bradyrhizobium sp. LMTR 3]|uniref:hypothetical protein n=1 Tax=Bradyrhizobium sp. LMTR 3 TaxID=189873 RepID=UPI00159F05B7|nr:hypothetical protein [Bradyrhizobium sp. LMTR 3]